MIDKIYSIISIIILLYCFSSCNSSLKNLESLSISNICFSDFQDGKYIGKYFDGKYDYETQSYISGGKIVRIDVIKNKNNKNSRKAVAILDRIIERQSLRVEAVSGATLSCKALLKTVEKAFSRDSTHTTLPN